MVDLVWIVAIIFLIIGVVELAVTQRISLNFWWISPIIGSLIYAANRKPIFRDSLVAGFYSWFFGTILGLATGFVSSVQIGEITIQFLRVDFAILSAMLGGLGLSGAASSACIQPLRLKKKLEKRLAFGDAKQFWVR